MGSTTTNNNNTGTQSNHQQLDDGDSDWMRSIQTESEEPSHQKVKGRVDNVFHESSSTGSISVGTNASSEEGYSPDCSSDQQLDSESDNDSDGMQSSQTESEEQSVPKVTSSTDETVLLESSSTTCSFGVGKYASSGEGYRTDCSAFSDQASDQSFSCAVSGQKQKSALKVTWNLLDLEYTNTERECVAPGLSSSNKQNRRHHCSNHHRRRSQPRPYARDRAHVSPSDLNALVSDNSHKEQANAPGFVGTQALPQLKGVRFPHPMDPRRIDISAVGHVQAPVPALATIAASLATTTTRNK
jgi:hypothetical protein